MRFPALRAALQKLVLVEEGEIKALLWSCSYFFFLLSSFYILRPVRDAMGATEDTRALTGLYMGTLAGTLLANPIFGWLVSRFPRRTFIPIVYHFLVVNLLLLYGGLYFLPDEQKTNVARVFFVWVSVFNMFAVSVFWGLMADIFHPEQGKRLFGFITAGGTLGAVAGALLTTTLAEWLGPIQMLLIAACLMELAVFSVHRLVKITKGGQRVPPTLKKSGPWEGIILLLKSPYLLGICLYIVLYTWSSTFLYFEQAGIVKEQLIDPGQKTAYFGKIDLYVNLICLLFGGLLTGRILKGFGIGATLALLPLITVIGLLGIGFVPTLGMLMLVQIVRRAAEYSISKPARENLYTVVTPKEKYVSKNLMDTFVYRGGDALGATAFNVIKNAGLSSLTVAYFFLPLGVLWAALSWILGKKHSKMSSAFQERA